MVEGTCCRGRFILLSRLVGLASFLSVPLPGLKNESHSAVFLIGGGSEAQQCVHNTHMVLGTVNQSGLWK